MNISMRQKQTYNIGNRLGLPRGRRGKGEIRRGKLVYIEWISKKILLYSTGNYSQYPVINHNGKEYEIEYIYV